MHKDQDRVREALLPSIVTRAVTEGAANERDCTVLIRAFVQGPDPLFILETCPDQFRALCDLLCLTVESGREAIERAHWQGPGVLLEGTGFTEGMGQGTKVASLPEAFRQEALWLILADVSDCTEDGYSESITLVERLQRAVRSGIRLAEVIRGATEHVSILDFAEASLRKFQRTTTFTRDERGFVHTTEDHGFYVAYKAGEAVCAVQAPSGLTFWGTNGSITLDEAGVVVDKKISPCFGLVFAPKA